MNKIKREIFNALEKASELGMVVEKILISKQYSEEFDNDNSKITLHFKDKNIDCGKGLASSYYGVPIAVDSRISTFKLCYKSTK